MCVLTVNSTSSGSDTIYYPTSMFSPTRPGRYWTTVIVSITLAAACVEYPAGRFPEAAAACDDHIAKTEINHLLSPNQSRDQGA